MPKVLAIQKNWQCTKLIKKLKYTAICNVNWHIFGVLAHCDDVLCKSHWRLVKSCSRRRANVSVVPMYVIRWVTESCDTAVQRKRRLHCRRSESTACPRVKKSDDQHQYASSLLLTLKRPLLVVGDVIVEFFNKPKMMKKVLKDVMIQSTRYVSKTFFNNNLVRWQQGYHLISMLFLFCMPLKTRLLKEILKVLQISGLLYM